MLSSDETAFGGFENLSKKYDAEFASTAADYDGRPHSIQVGQSRLTVAHVPAVQALSVFLAAFFCAPLYFICHKVHYCVERPFL